MTDARGAASRGTVAATRAATRSARRRLLRAAGLATLLSTLGLWAAWAEGPSDSVAHFLRLGAGARAGGMGGAGSAASEDATALYWNPSLLSLLKSPEAAFSHAEHLRTARYETVHAAWPGRLGTLGAGLSYLSHDSLQRVTAAGAATGNFSPSSLAASIGYGTTLSSGPLRLGLGGAGKAVRETLDDVTASAFALDLGAWLEHERFPRWRLAGAARHLGGPVRFRAESESLPTELSLGALRLREGARGASSALELVVPLAGDPEARLGAEWGAPLARELTGFLRAGFETTPARHLGVPAGITFGAGARHGNLNLDLSFQMAGELGHKLKLSARWRFEGRHTPAAKGER